MPTSLLHAASIISYLTYNYVEFRSLLVDGVLQQLCDVIDDILNVTVESLHWEDGSFCTKIAKKAVRHWQSTVRMIVEASESSQVKCIV